MTIFNFTCLFFDIMVDIYLEYEYFDLQIMKNLNKVNLIITFNTLEFIKFTKPSYYNSERQIILQKKYHYDLFVILKIAL